MSSAVSSVLSSVAPTATAACGATLYDIPVADIACAMPYGGNHTDILSECCKDADIVAYRNNCGLYCLVMDQTVDELTECLFDKGAARTAVWCSGNGTESATATEQPELAATASASVVSSGDDNDDDNKDDKDDNKDDDKDEDSKDAKETGNNDNAAGSVVPQASVTTLGVAIGALLFSAMTFGAFQI